MKLSFIFGKNMEADFYKRFNKDGKRPQSAKPLWLLLKRAGWRRYSAFTESLLMQSSGNVALLNVWQQPHPWLDCFSRALGWILIGRGH